MRGPDGPTPNNAIQEQFGNWEWGPFRSRTSGMIFLSLHPVVARLGLSLTKRGDWAGKGAVRGTGCIPFSWEPPAVREGLLQRNSNVQQRPPDSSGLQVFPPASQIAPYSLCSALLLTRAHREWSAIWDTPSLYGLWERLGYSGLPSCVMLFKEGKYRTEGWRFKRIDLS